MENHKSEQAGITWLIDKFKNRKIIKKKEEIEELKLDIQKAKLEKELEMIKKVKGGKVNG